MRALALCALAVGCAPDISRIDVNLMHSMSRSLINSATTDCMLPGASEACAGLGTLAMHADAQSMSAFWGEGIDRRVGAQAFVRGCTNGSGKACRGLIELELADTAEQWQWAFRRAAYLRAPVRSKEEVAAELAAARAKAATDDRDEKQRNQQQQADLDAKYRAGWTEAASNVASAYAEAGAMTSAAQLAPKGVSAVAGTRTGSVAAPAGHPFTPPPSRNQQARAAASTQLAKSVALQQQQAQQQQAQRQTVQQQQQRAIQLQQCLSEPITPMRVAGQSNPFLADVQGFQALLDKAQGECAGAKTWPAWNECMGSHAMSALWSIEDRAIADSGDLFRRYTAVASFYTTPAVCLEPHFKGTHDDCMLNSSTLDLVRGGCARRLQENIDVLDCEFKMLPGVWNAEAARDDAAAHTRHDADCNQRFGN